MFKSLLSKKRNWAVGLFIITYHLVLAVTLPFYLYFVGPSVGLILASIGLFLLSGVSITAGYHRYFSHKSYKTNKWIEAILLFFGTIATQGSALRWSFEHRLHHAYVDTKKDPYSIKKGFWHAHFTWLFDDPAPIDPKVVPDLLKNKLVIFQHRFYPLLMILTNGLLITLAAICFHDVLGAILIYGLLRMFFLHHFTWFINSLAHMWGSKTYSGEHTAVDNYVISLVTFGEGYHNYHHTFANDYRNGIKWFHFDPSKWLIWTLSKLRLATGLRRMDSYTIKKRQLLADNTTLLKKIRNHVDDKAGLLETKLSDVSNQIISNLNMITGLLNKYRAIKKEKSDLAKEKCYSIRKEVKHLRSKLHGDWKSWAKLSKGIRKLKPATLV